MKLLVLFIFIMIAYRLRTYRIFIYKGGLVGFDTPGTDRSLGLINYAIIIALLGWLDE